MTTVQTERVKRVNPELLKGKGPTARYLFKKRLANLVQMEMEEQARGYRPKQRSAR